MNTIVEMKFGSHVYGTNLPTSDTDFKAIAIPPKRDILLQRAFRSINLSTGNDLTKNTAQDIDREIFSLHHYLKLLIEGQTVALDMLFTPNEFHIGKTSSWWTILQANKHKLLSKKMSAFAGYCQAQAAKYSLKGSNLSAYEAAMNFFGNNPFPHEKVGNANVGALIQNFSDIKHLNGKEEPLIKIVDIPHKTTGKSEYYLQVGPKTKVPFNASVKLAHEIFKNQYEQYGERAKLAQKNEGIDWKALMHAVRVCEEGIELCRTGNITFPRPEAALLLAIRKGEADYNNVASLIESLLFDLNQVKTSSNLPDEPDVRWIESFVEDIYATECKYR